MRVINMQTRSMKAYAIFALLAVGGCDPNINAAKNAVKETLKDPESAQFRNVRTVETLPPGESNHGYVDKTHPGLPAGVCGEYNAKNALGGYTGFSGFIWLPKEGRLISVNEDGLISMPSSGSVSRWLPWKDYCRDRVPEDPEVTKAKQAKRDAETAKAVAAWKKANPPAKVEEVKCNPKLAAEVGLTCK